MKKKCLVMFSGGLDSRLAIKIMQEQGFEVLAVYFKLPFGCSFEEDVKGFVEENGEKIKIFDCTKGKLLQEYLNCLKEPKYGKGAGANPCVDCKIFLFKKAREFADEKNIDLVVSGDVLGERPMSQMMNSMRLIEEGSGLKGRLLRPLSAKKLAKTEAEKKGLVNRENLYDIHGRRREKQMALAKKFNIKYPHPAGGCLLCEKALKNRFERLFNRGVSDEEINLVGIGRHFKISPSEKVAREEKLIKQKGWHKDDTWIVLGRDKRESEIIEEIGKKIGELVVPDFIGPSALIIGKSKKARGIVDEMIWAYSKKGSLEDRKKFDEWRL